MLACLRRSATAVLTTAGLLTGAFVASPVAAQSTPSQDRTLRIFLDCQQTRNCNSTEFRTEIQFVDWVRDRNVADVHIIMTSQSSGAGTEYVLDYIGLGDLQGVDEQLTHASYNTNTQDEILGGLTNVLRLGLVRYMLHTGQADKLDLSVVQAAEVGDNSEVVEAQQNDPWNYWVFRAQLNGSMNGEERESSRSLRGSFNASRTTADWKINLTFNANYNLREVELNSGDIFKNETSDWNMNGLIARSVTGHWSSGIDLNASTSTRQNRKFSGRTAAAVEWDYFPYEQANRRSLILQYELGVSRVQYEEVTVFDKLEETLADQRLSLNYNSRQPWGDASVGGSYESYLHDLSLNSLSVNGRIGIRLFLGFDLDLNASYDKINNQLYLSAAGLTDEEILISRQDLGTSYEYNMGMGFTYRFGSIFNSVVNNRFRGGRGGGGGPGGPGGGGGGRGGGN